MFFPVFAIEQHDFLTWKSMPDTSIRCDSLQLTRKRWDLEARPSLPHPTGFWMLVIWSIALASLRHCQDLPGYARICQEKNRLTREGRIGPATIPLPILLVLACPPKPRSSVALANEDFLFLGLKQPVQTPQMPHIEQIGRAMEGEMLFSVTFRRFSFCKG